MVGRALLALCLFLVIVELGRAFFLQYTIASVLHYASKVKAPDVRRKGESKAQSAMRAREQLIKSLIDRAYPKARYNCLSSAPCFEWQVNREFTYISGEINWFFVFRLRFERGYRG
jgi:hypothetical protein